MAVRICSAVAVVALLVATYASAAGAASLPVLIEKLSPAAKACGLSESQLETVAVRTLDNSRWQPDPDAGGWLNVRVSVTRARRNPCVARVSVQMKASAKRSPSDGIAKPKQRSRAQAVVLCSKTGTYSPPRDIFSQGVESAVEYSINGCLGSLKY
jgi:hypothetical protein